MSTTRIGVIGAGKISSLHLDGMTRHPDRFQACAVLDPDLHAARECAERYGIEHVYADLDAMLADKAFDIGIVCTPTHVRSEVVLPLLEAGVPVLCEKPFGETYEEAAVMAQASDRLKVPLAVNQNFRDHFPFRMARDCLAEGKLGKPLHLTQLVKMCRRDTGWRNNRGRYVMSVMSIHWFDGYRYLFGAEPVSVYCRGVNSPLIAGGPDTAVSVILTFPDGAIACLSESFSSLARNWTCHVDCERGSLNLSMKQMQVLLDGADPCEVPTPFDKTEATFRILDDLATAVAENRQPAVSAADNLKSMAILEACYRSLTEHREVLLEEINA